MIGSAQIKIVLENNWHLDDLQRDGCFANLQFQVQRRHGGRHEMAEVG
jgi:hypothetical protein